MEVSTQKTCPKCNTTYKTAKGNFYKNSYAKDGYTYYCRFCCKNHSKEQYEELKKGFTPNNYFIGKIKKAMNDDNKPINKFEVVLYEVETSQGSKYYFCELIGYQNETLIKTIIDGEKYYNKDKVDAICDNYISNLYYMLKRGCNINISYSEVQGKEIRNHIVNGVIENEYF